MDKMKTRKFNQKTEFIQEKIPAPKTQNPNKSYETPTQTRKGGKNSQPKRQSNSQSKKQELPLDTLLGLQKAANHGGSSGVRKVPAF